MEFLVFAPASGSLESPLKAVPRKQPRTEEVATDLLYQAWQGLRFYDGFILLSEFFNLVSPWGQGQHQYLKLQWQAQLTSLGTNTTDICNEHTWLLGAGGHSSVCFLSVPSQHKSVGVSKWAG